MKARKKEKEKMSEEKKKKYEVTIKESKGACDKELFQKMIKRGDIVATKLADMIGKTVKITGYAICHVETDDKDFEIAYFAVNNGYISSGSEYFIESVKEYFDDCEYFNLKEIKTKKGKTYKAMPVLADSNAIELESSSEDDLPF